MYRAKDTFWAPDNRRIVKGDLVAQNDPVVTGREALFEAVVVPQALVDQEPPAAPGGPEHDDTTGPAGPDGTGEDDGPEHDDPDGEPAPAAKKAAARKTTAAARKTPGGTQ